jgi:carboxylesterase type B
VFELAADVLIGPAAWALAKPLYPYPQPVPADLRVYASDLLGDGLFLCATRNATEAMQAAQPFRKSPAYHWLYSHQMSWSTQMWGANFTECDTKICHGSDLPGWFHPMQAPSPGYGNYTAEEDAFSASMQWYYANFAATGVPGTGNPAAPTAEWPAYTAATRQSLNLEVPRAGGIAVLNAWRAEYCALWDASIGYSVY